MPALSALVSSDSRQPLQRLKRKQLELIAEKRGIPFDPATTGKLKLIPLLEAAGISGYEEEFAHITNWRQVVQKDENGNQRIEAYPDPPSHKTSSKIIDYGAEIRKRAEKQEEVDFEMEALRRENQDLKAVIEERLERLENQAPELPLERWMPWQLKQVAKQRGIAYKGLSKEELVDALRG